MLQERVKGHTKVLCKVTKFLSALQAEALCRVPLMSFRMSEPRAKRAGITARVPRRKGRKNKDSACSRPE